MAVSPKNKAARFETIADVIKDLGGISPRRIRAHPFPGQATEKDVIRIHDRTDRLFELVDGVLVEKVMSFPESALTCDVIKFLGVFLDQNRLGFLTGPDGAVRLMPGLIRIPDVSFIAWSQLPKRERPTDPIAGLAPALAVEVLSKGNTKREMDRKVREYFLCGVRLIWLVDLKRRAVTVYSAPDQAATLTEGEVLDGGDVLPGLSLPVLQLFAEVPAAPPMSGGRPKKRTGGRE
jgi:Uma2 family endonuclease